MGKQFKVTRNHIRLLQSAYMGWNDCEFGAPSIDCKRPYGNSYVFGDIAEIIGIKPNDRDGEFTSEQMSMMSKLHEELEIVLQILTNNLHLEEGWYELSEDYKWHEIPPPPTKKKFEVRGIHSLNYFAVVEAETQHEALEEADLHNLIDDDFWHEDPESWRFEIVGAEETEDE